MAWLRKIFDVSIFLIGLPIVAPLLAAGLVILIMGLSGVVPAPIESVHAELFVLLVEMEETGDELFRILCIAMGLGVSLTSYYGLFFLWERMRRPVHPPEPEPEPERFPWER